MNTQTCQSLTGNYNVSRTNDFIRAVVGNKYRYYIKNFEIVNQSVELTIERIFYEKHREAFRSCVRVAMEWMSKLVKGTVQGSLKSDRESNNQRTYNFQFKVIFTDNLKVKHTLTNVQ